MVSKKLCVLLLWTKVASALEGLIKYVFDIPEKFLNKNIGPQEPAESSDNNHEYVSIY